VSLLVLVGAFKSVLARVEDGGRSTMLVSNLDREVWAEGNGEFT
jgi:hypothetical protein